jgi:hypothetical protein
MASNTSSTSGAGISPAAQQKNAPKGLYLALTLLQSGVSSQVPSKTSLTIGGQSVAQAALLSELTADIALYTAVIGLRNQLAAAVAARNAAVPTVKQRYALIVKAIEGLFAPGSPVLASFGIHPRKSPAPRTAEEKAVSAAKAKLTRQATGVKTSAEKKALRTVGTPTVTITPTGTVSVPQIVINGPAGGSTPQSGAPAAPAGSSTSQPTAPAAPAGVNTTQSSAPSGTGAAAGSTSAT